MKKAAENESKKKSGRGDSRSIRLASCVLGDTDLQFFSAVRTTEKKRDREKEHTFRGSGAETNSKAQGVNIQHLQWDLAATGVYLFF